MAQWASFTSWTPASTATGNLIVDLDSLGDHPIFSAEFGFAKEMSSFWRKTHTHVGFEAFYGGQFALSTHLIVPNNLVIPLTDAAPKCL